MVGWEATGPQLIVPRDYECSGRRVGRSAWPPLIHTGSSSLAIYCSADTKSSTNLRRLPYSPQLDRRPVCRVDANGTASGLGKRANWLRRRRKFSSSLLTTNTSRPTPARRLSTFFPVPLPILHEPQPPDVDHTSPKLATYRSLSSGHRLECLLLLASVSWCSRAVLGVHFGHAARREFMAHECDGTYNVCRAERTGKCLSEWQRVQHRGFGGALKKMSVKPEKYTQRDRE